MASIIETNPKLHLGIYDAKDGSYAMYEESEGGIIPFTSRGGAKNWYGCREQFLTYDFKEKPTTFLLAHTPGVRDNIKAFMTEIENKLNLPESDRLVFWPVNHARVTAIQPSNWWRSIQIRREILTIFLRVGQVYVPANKNFEQALFSHDYTINTRKAVEAFLAGRTILKNISCSGWVNLFNDRHVKLYALNESYKKQHLEYLAKFNVAMQNLCFEN